MKREQAVFFLFFGLGLIPVLSFVNSGQAQVQQGAAALFEGQALSLHKRLDGGLTRERFAPRALRQPPQKSADADVKRSGVVPLKGGQKQKKAPWQRNLETEFLALRAMQRSS